MTANHDSLASGLAAELGITEVEVRRHLADAVRAGLLAVEDHATDPSMARLVARFPGESA
jgi:predicted ArsR family transcriptional regulator